MTIRPATPEDLPAIAAIQAASPEASQWEPRDYLQYDCLISDHAFIVTRQLAPGESEVLNLAVAPEARRAGVARKLLKHALDKTPGSWFLEVRESNLAAIKLYESTGFRPSGTRAGYYADSSESAIVMHYQS